MIVWDDWGGPYDNLPPKQMNYGVPGFCVPAVVAFPHAKATNISETNYEFGSILRYIEEAQEGRDLSLTSRCLQRITSHESTSLRMPASIWVIG